MVRQDIPRVEIPTEVLGVGADPILIATGGALFVLGRIENNGVRFGVQFDPESQKAKDLVVFDLTAGDINLLAKKLAAQVGMVVVRNELLHEMGKMLQGMQIVDAAALERAKKEPSPLFCQHANESVGVLGRVCKCSADCYCRTVSRMCPEIQ